MNRKKKILILILLSLSVFFVYNLTDKPTIVYTTLGDSFSNGQNCYGGYTYGYEDYILDYLKKKNNVEFIDIYTNKNESITTLNNYLITNNGTVINNKNYNIKKVLTESTIVTISIGINDIIYETNVDKSVLESQYKEDKLVNYIYDNYKKLMNEILKYSTNNIYIIGYPVRNNQYKNIILKLNKKYKQYSQKEKINFIDSNKILEKEEYFENDDSIYPNTLGYKKIAEEIINIYKNRENS